MDTCKNIEREYLRVHGCGVCVTVSDCDVYTITDVCTSEELHRLYRYQAIEMYEELLRAPNAIRSKHMHDVLIKLGFTAPTNAALPVYTHKAYKITLPVVAAPSDFWYAVRDVFGQH